MSLIFYKYIYIYIVNFLKISNISLEIKFVAAGHPLKAKIPLTSYAKTGFIMLNQTKMEIHVNNRV